MGPCEIMPEFSQLTALAEYHKFKWLYVFKKKLKEKKIATSRVRHVRAISRLKIFQSRVVPQYSEMGGSGRVISKYVIRIRPEY